MEQKRLLFTFLLSVAFGFTGHAQTNNTITSSSHIATFKFTAGVSTYIWSGDKRNKGEMGSWIEVIVTKGDSTQGLYVVLAKGSNGDKFNISFFVIGKNVIRHSRTFRKATASVIVDTKLHAIDWDNNDESDSTVQLSFTNFHDNMADGTFRRLVSSGNQKLTITKGEFQNLKIYKKIQQ